VEKIVGGGFPMNPVMNALYAPNGCGNFSWPLGGRFELARNSVTYIGHIEMINRPRRDGEKRSGGLFPLIDQAASGFYGGTFDVKVTDRSHVDIPSFIERYPELRGVDIKKSILQL
jgi:hypothetical protein